jgi:protein phosphatase
MAQTEDSTTNAPEPTESPIKADPQGNSSPPETSAIYESISTSSVRGDRTDRLHADELAAGWADYDQKAPDLHATVRVGFKTDLGSIRENNEDKFDLIEPTDSGFLATKGRLYGVADGMGGHSAGQIASELALKTVIQRYYRDPSPHIVDSLRYAINEANALVFDTAQLIPERQGMGTTLTVGVIREDRLTVAHVGDSRAYLIRDGEPRQITHDHSLVAEQVRLGAMTMEDAASSPLRNIILRSIGTGPVVQADFYEERLQVGDFIVICSDGLTGHVSPSELADYVATTDARRRGPSLAAYRLVDLANSRGGRDNITVVVIEVTEIAPYAAAVSAVTETAESPLVDADHTIFDDAPKSTADITEPILDLKPDP